MENGTMRKPLGTYLACSVAVFMISMDNLIVTNALGDRFGRRRLMMIGAVQGVGAAITMPLTVTLIASVTPSRRRVLALVVLATAGLFGIVFGLVRGGSHGWTSVPVLGALTGGGLLLGAFGAWEARAARPMLPLSLFRSRGFCAASATMMLTTMGMFGVIFLAAQFLQSVLGYTPLTAGVHGLPWTAAIEVTPAIPYADLVPPFLIAGAGLGFFFAPITQLTLRYAPGPLEGIASGTSNALRQAGTVLGVAVLAAAAAILAASALVILVAPETRRPGRRAGGGAGVSEAERAGGAGTLPRSVAI
jgi:MFS family permease